MTPDWARIKAEYVSSGISYKKLAEKYGICVSVINLRGCEEKWVEARKKWREQTVKKAVEKASCARAKELAKLFIASDKLDALIVQLQEQIEHTQMVLISGDGAPCREISELSKAVKTAVDVKRNLYGIPTQAEAEAQRVAAERLEIERRKADAEDGGEPIEIVIHGAEGLDV